MKTAKMQRTKFASRRCGGLSGLVTLVIGVCARAQAATPPPLPEAPPATLSTSGAAPPVAQTAIVVREERSNGFGSRYRSPSPGLAAALSLTPVPIDFGNLYAENVGWAMGYTSGELTLMTGMMWLGAGHMCHSRDRCGDWSDVETGGMIALAIGYVGVKVISGFHAASAARDFDDFHQTSRPRLVPVLTPTHGGASVGLTASF